MGNKFGVVALMVLAFGLASTPRANAGADMIIDNSAQAPPPPIYYAPPPVRVVVYTPPPPIRVYGYQRIYVRRPHCHARWR